LDINHCWVLNKRVHGYENGSCGLLENRSLLQNQQACLWLRKWKLRTLGNQIVAAESTGVSMAMKMEVADPWKPDRCCGTNRRVHGYENESCGLLETRLLLWNQQACPWLRKWKLRTLGNQIVAAEPTGVSMDTTKQQMPPRIQDTMQSAVQLRSDSFVSYLSFVIYS
jgi:hypothetical protein